MLPRKFSWLNARFFTMTGKIELFATEVDVSDGSYPTAILLNLRFRLMLGLAGLKFSLNESDSKFPVVCRDRNANARVCRSSESLCIWLLAPLNCGEFWLVFISNWSAGLLELSSVGWGAQGKFPVDRVLLRIPQRFLVSPQREVSSKASVRSCENCSIVLSFHS